jgi:hypothetical protein
VTAPYAEWTERKASCSGPGLLPSLAFLGWLHGYAIAFQALADGRTVYGVGDLIHGHACWLGLRDWRVTGTAGRELGRRLWRVFLDAGGPWPTEFRLQAVPLDAPFSEDDELESPDALVFHHQGARCRHRWTLAALRERPG